MFRDAIVLQDNQKKKHVFLLLIIHACFRFCAHPCASGKRFAQLLNLMRRWGSAGPVLLGRAVRSAIPRASGADGAAGSAAAAGRIARLAVGAARTRAADGDGPYAQL